jgi:hypothetical protein
LRTTPLIISGAQKSASTSVAAWFTESDSVVQLGNECIAFEGRVHQVRTRKLRARVAHLVGRGIIPLLKRPELLHNAVMCHRASSAFPDAMAVAILRNPVDRSVSAWEHYRTMGVIDPCIRLRDCVAIWKQTGHGRQSPAGQIIGYSLYSMALAELEQAFRNTCVVFHERVVSDPQQALRPVLDRLNLRDEPSEALPVLNTRGDVARNNVIPPRIAGPLAFRWDDAEGHLSPRSLGWRVVALGRVAAQVVSYTGIEAGTAATEEDRGAVSEATLGDLDRLEERLGVPVPSAWRQG